MSRLIALYSSSMGSGKTTIAEHLVSLHGFERVAFATPLKQMAEGLLDALGMSAAEVRDRVWGHRKEEMIPGVELTSRRLQQLLGTEFGRDMIRDSLWVDIAMEAVRQHRAAGKSVVIDDMRFPNEYEAVLAAGGECWKVNRPGARVTAAHVSEGGLDALPLNELHNTSSVQDLLIAADALFTH